MNSLRRLICLVAAALWATSPAAMAHSASQAMAGAVAKPAAGAAQLRPLMDEYYLASARFEPVNATFYGDSRFDDQLGLSIAPANRARHSALLQRLSERLHNIDVHALGPQDRTSAAILDYQLRTELALLAFPTHLLPINQMESMPAAIANLADGKGSQPIATPAQYRVFLRRLAQLTPWIDQAIANMREGMRSGVVLPKTLIIAALPQYQQLAAAAVESGAFYGAVRAMPASFSAADRRAISAAYAAEIGQRLHPALVRLATFLERDYLPAGGAAAGIDALPNGASWYRAAVASSTTTSLTPEQIHATGLAEVARIQQQFAELAPRLGYQGDPAGLPKWVGQQARFKPFTDEKQILSFYRQLDATLANKLPALFTLVPRSPLDERLEPELTRATASDHYTPPNLLQRRPGVFWSVVNDPRTYDSTKMTSLFLHEGRPGHHFQLALQLETALPDFRRFGGNNAFVEGWALYAETLGFEMGLYDDPAQRFGHLNSELLRAARLVVDTGLHAKGWSREKAIAYLRDTNGYSEAVAQSAIERYMAWPGQALGYKIGALKIAELRKRASTAMGARFTLPAFHAIVIGEGSLPLSILEEKVDGWIATAR